KRLVLQKLLNCPKAAVTRIAPRTRSGPPPTSFAQQRLWFLDQLLPGNPTYSIPAALRLKTTLNVAALRRSLNEIVRRHEALRTSFGFVDGQAVQVIADALELDLPVAGLRGIPAAERESEALRLAAAEARRPFDLARGPLLRANLLQLGEADYVFLLVMHHIVTDGWSMGVFFRELTELYGAFVIGRPSLLAELPIQYADYAVWQRQWRGGAAAAGGVLEGAIGGPVGARTADRSAAAGGAELSRSASCAAAGSRSGGRSEATEPA